jgi:hypothetical protein
MIIADSALHPFIYKKLIQTERFLDAAGVARTEYLIARYGEPIPETGPQIIVLYSDDRFDNNDFLARVSMPLGEHGLSLVMGVRDALILASFLLEDRQRLALALQAAQTGPGLAAAVAAFSLAPAAVRPSVAAWAEGQFIAPDNNGLFTVFNVDSHGELSLWAQSSQAGDAALALWALSVIPASGIAERRAKFMPP